MRSKFVRPLGVLVLGLGPAILFAGCGGDATGAERTIVSMDSTAYVVKDPVTTTSLAEGQTPGGPTVDAEGRTEQPQEYEIQSGDWPLRVVEMFGIPGGLDALMNFNDWSDWTNFVPGTVIRIPGGSLVPNATGGETTDTSGDTSTGDTSTGDTSGETTETTPATLADPCATGSYTIEEGDTSRVAVAEKFDVTVEELDAANANTAGYSSFYPGLQIVIPAPDDC